MANASHNASVISDDRRSCQHRAGAAGILVLTELLTLLVGQPLLAKLLWTNLTSRRPTDVLNFNLAVFHDVMYLLCACHLLMIFVLEDFHLQFLNMVLVYAQVGGPMSLCFISLERYVAVIRPTSYRLLKTYRWRELCSAAVWLLSLSITLLVALPVQIFSSSVLFTLKSIPLVVMSIMMEVMMVCGIHISRVLKTSGPGQDKLHPVKRRAFITVCATTVITMVFYTPVTILQRFDSGKDFPLFCLFRAINMLLLSAASIVHPVFYLHTHGKLFSCRRGEKKDP